MRVARVAPVCVALVAGLALTGPVAPARAHHADEILFADEGDVTLKWADARAGAPITVCNVGAEPATNLDFGILGFEFEGTDGPVETSTVLELVSGDGPADNSALPAGTCRDLSLRRKSGAELEPDTYPGLVVATATGGIARKKVTVERAEPAGSAGPKRGETLAAADLTDQTLPATNFVPSLLNHWGPTLMVMVLVGLCLLVVLCLSPGLNAPFIALTVAGVLVAFYFAAAEGHTFSDRDEQGGPSKVSVKSLPIRGVNDGTYGVVTDDEANIGKLVVEERRLQPAGLERAGAYSGKLDLTPGAEKGDATVKVNVRDWWLWAFLTIALGVWLGYVLRRFFESRIPRDKLIAQTYRLAADATWTVEGAPAYSIEGHVRDEAARIATLARRDHVAATAAFATMKADLQAYARMAKVLQALRAKLIAMELAGGADDKLRKARSLLSKPLVVYDKAEYDERVTAATAAETDLDAALEQERAGRRDFVEGGGLPPIAPEDQPLSDFAEASETEVRNAERRGSAVAGFLAVASGLSALYFTDGVWGTPGDYLAGFLWGAAVAEGLKYVKALTDRTWGPA
jgi:hypothetical protein